MNLREIAFERTDLPPGPAFGQRKARVVVSMVAPGDGNAWGKFETIPSKIDRTLHLEIHTTLLQFLFIEEKGRISGVYRKGKLDAVRTDPITVHVVGIRFARTS